MAKAAATVTEEPVEPDRAAAFDRDFLECATRSNQGAPGGPAEYPYGYLEVIARTRVG